MNLYLVFSCLLVIISLFSILEDKNKNNLLLYLLGIVSFLIASFRYQIGTDYKTYFGLFKYLEIKKSMFLYTINYNHFEIGFRLIILLLKKMVNSPFFLFSFFSGITIFMTIKAIKNFSDNYILSFLIYFNVFYLTYTLNGICQGIIMGIFLLSIDLFEKNKIVKIFFLSFFSSLIHSSGIFILLGYIFSKLEVKKDKKIILIILSFIFWKLEISRIILKYLLYISPSFLVNKINLYQTYEFFKVPLNMINILQRMLLILPFLIYDKIYEYDKKIKLCVNIYFWSFILYLNLGFISMLSTRINMFYRSLEIIIIPYLFYKSKNKVNKILLWIFIVAWSLLILYSLAFNPDYYPYKTFLGG